MTFSAAAGRAGEPNDPLLRLWKAATALREHQGDGHVAALLTAVINPCEALAAAAAPQASALALEALGSTAFDQPHTSAGRRIRSHAVATHRRSLSARLSRQAIVDDRFGELRVGHWEGLSEDEIAERWPEQWQR